MKYAFLIHFSREEEIKYLAHLDMLRLWQRIFKCAELHVAYTQGFNPHMCFTIAVPLALGMTSSAEYLEVSLEKMISPEQLKQKIGPLLPKGLNILGVRLSPYQESIAAKAALLQYEVRVREIQENAEEIKQKITDFNEAAEIKIVKHTKKGSKTINIRPLVRTLSFIDSTQEDGTARLEMQLVTGPTGSVKPENVLQALSLKYKVMFPHRKNLFFVTPEGKYYTP